MAGCDAGGVQEKRTPGQDKHRSTTLVTILLLHARACISPSTFRPRFLCFLFHHCCRAWHCGAENARNMPLLFLAAPSTHTAALCWQLPAGTRLAAGTRLVAAPPPPRLLKQVKKDHVALWPRLRGGRDKLQASALAAVYPMPLPLPTLLSLDLLSPYLLGPAS